MNAKVKNPTDPFVIKRVFDAPRDVVFEAWTNPEHLKEWMGPAGMKTEYKRCEIRTGGVAHWSMTAPDGMKMWGFATYKQIDKPRKIVYVQRFSDENEGPGIHPMAPDWPREMETTIVFEEKGKQTEITLTWVPLNTSDKEAAIFDAARESMIGGWGGSFAALDAHLKKQR